MVYKVLKAGISNKNNLQKHCKCHRKFKGRMACGFFLKEIPEAFTVRTTLPIKAVVDKVITCNSCYSQLEKLWFVCPYCGQKVKENGQKKTIRTDRSPVSNISFKKSTKSYTLNQ